MIMTAHRLDQATYSNHLLPYFPTRICRHSPNSLIITVILAHMQLQVVTADFHYLRLHGHTTLYGGSYKGHHQKWAATISKLSITDPVTSG